LVLVMGALGSRWLRPILCHCSASDV
jgi:hypothetical protein